MHCRLLVLGLMLAALTTHGQTVADPEAPGPHPVGVTTLTVVDCARDDTYVGGPRTLLTEIWYPAADEARNQQPTALLDYYLGATDPAVHVIVKAAFGADLLAADKTFDSKAVRDARVREGKYPLVVFSHGNGGMRSQNVFWCEHIASHGYIVVAPDHSGNSLITMLDGKVLPYDGQGRERSAEDRPADVRFLIDTMARFDRGGDSRFRGRVDLDHVAVAGHSFGGFTASTVADLDDRVDAIIPMAGIAREWQAHDTPLLAFVATEDATIGLEGNERIYKYYDESTGPKYLVEFRDAGHYSFTEMYRLNPTFGDGVGTGTRTSDQKPLTYVAQETVYPLVNGYSTAFLGLFLKGQAGYRQYLEENQAPDALHHKHHPAP